MIAQLLLAPTTNKQTNKSTTTTTTIDCATTQFVLLPRLLSIPFEMATENIISTELNLAPSTFGLQHGQPVVFCSACLPPTLCQAEPINLSKWIRLARARVVFSIAYIYIGFSS